MSILHKTYLPFTEKQLRDHFVKVDSDKSDNIEKHIQYYKKNIENYSKYESGQIIPRKDVATIRQIEKDERFWTASTMMSIYYSNNRTAELSELLTIAFGPVPPLDSFNSWEECLDGDLELFFEPNLPSPPDYLEWLQKNASKHQFIPYLLEHAKKSNGEFRKDLEGATNVDALWLNKTNGFSVLIEAKVLSDISSQITYDSMRNQLVRNLDVMLEANKELSEPLHLRNPNRSLLLLLTPKTFKDYPTTRLYGYKYKDYKSNPESIGKDLQHRKLSKEQCTDYSKRIGWITWVDCKIIKKNAVN